MTDEMIALGRRALACKGWRWMRGMTSMEGGTFIAYTDCDEAFWLMHPDDGCDAEPVAWRLPDLSDPATLGCLLALVRKAWGDSKTCARPDLEDDVWYVVTRSGLAFAASEAEALVAALESAP
jgi:hypothetical protein